MVDIFDELRSFAVSKQIKAQKDARIDVKGSMRSRNMDCALGEAKAWREVIEKINALYNEYRKEA